MRAWTTASFNTDVQNGIHHAGHRFASTRTARQQQWVFGIAVLFTHAGFGSSDGFFDLRLQFWWILTFVGVVVSADFGGDCKSGWYWKADAAHFRQVGSFTAEQLFLSAVAVCFAVTE